jgi:hypothetical protein
MTANPITRRFEAEYVDRHALVDWHRIDRQRRLAVTTVGVAGPAVCRE